MRRNLLVRDPKHSAASRVPVLRMRSWRRYAEALRINRSTEREKMKHHIMIALGLLMAVIFCFRMANALVAPGIGFFELYLLGGIFIAGWLIFSGLKERRAAREAADEREP